MEGGGKGRRFSSGGGRFGEVRKVWGGFLVSRQSFGAGRGGRRCGEGWAFLVRFSEKDDF